MKSINNDSIKEFINNFDVKCTGLFQNVHTPIYNYISSSEERIQNTINAVKDSNNASKLKTEIIMDELAEYLNKFKDHYGLELGVNLSDPDEFGWRNLLKTGEQP